MSIAKIETASGVTLVLNGNTVFASDDTSYWLQGQKSLVTMGMSMGMPRLFETPCASSWQSTAG